jgi:ABC-type transporter Mla subunit MlaD
MSTEWRFQLIGAGRTATLMALAAMVLAGSVLAQTPQERLAASVKEAREQLQSTSTDLQTTVGALNDLQKQSGDLRPAYDKFSESIAKTGNSAGLAAKLGETMAADSKAYFDSWLSEINGISNPDIRKVSTKRLNEVKKDYDQAVKEVTPLAPLFKPMMSDLEDFKSALGMDLTPDALKAHSKAMSKTTKSVAAFQEPIGKSLLALDKLSTALTPAAPATK